MSEQTINPLLDAATIEQAEALGLQARYIVEGYMSGEHKSPFRGFSIEFTQHREYVPGDDIRHLDWKVLGRTDRYYLKQYEQETNYVAHILLDGSASMRYGSKVGRGKGAGISKMDYGRRLAACLAYLVLVQRDAVSVGIFDNTVRQHLPRTGNMGSVHGIMTMLAAYNPSAETNIATVLHEMAGQVKRRGIVILISDLFDDEEKILDGIQHLRFGGNEVIVFHTMDPYELEFPLDGLVEFEGLELPEKVQAHPHDIRKSYLEEVNGFCDRLRQGCEKLRSHYVLINTRRPLAEVVHGYLAYRKGGGQ